MRYDRNEMLRNFLRCNAIEDETGLSEEELAAVSFGVDSENLLIESLKTLLIAHSSGEGEQVCFKRIGLKVDEMSHSDR